MRGQSRHVGTTYGLRVITVDPAFSACPFACQWRWGLPLPLRPVAGGGGDEGDGVDLDNQCEFEVVGAVVVVNGEVAAAVGRWDGDEVRVPDEVGSAVDEMHGEEAERDGVHSFAELAELFDRGHGVPRQSGSRLGIVLAKPPLGLLSQGEVDCRRGGTPTWSAKLLSHSRHAGLPFIVISDYCAGRSFALALAMSFAPPSLPCA